MFDNRGETKGDFIFMEKHFNFKNGRVGTTQLMSCGLTATVIAYRGCMNIDIEFENGTFALNKCYYDF